MPYVHYPKLTAAQQREARELRPKWSTEDFARFELWVKADGHVSRRGGHHRITEAEYRKVMAELDGSAVRSKGDLKGFKPGTRFTVSRG